MDPPAPTPADVAALAAELGRYEPIAAAYLFGSFARGEAGSTSDVDIGLVFRQRGESAADHHRLLGTLAARLESTTHPHPVDLVVLEPQGPVFCHEVLLDGQLIYEGCRERRVDFESDTIIRALDWRPTWNIAASERISGLRRWLSERQ